MAQHRNRISHARELYYILFIIFVVLLGVFSIWGRNGYLELRSAQRELQVRRDRVEALRQSNAERVHVIQALKSDKRAIEKYAREKGYGKKGELIQHLPKETK